MPGFEILLLPIVIVFVPLTTVFDAHTVKVSVLGVVVASVTRSAPALQAVTSVAPENVTSANCVQVTLPNKLVIGSKLIVIV